MHQADYDVLTRALARARRSALAKGPQSAVRQVEQTALVIAETLAGEYRTFDPAKFLLAACEAAAPSDLRPALRRELEARFGTAERRPRPNTARSSGLKPDDQIRTGYWKADTLVDMVLGEVSDSVGAMAAASALMAYGRVRTLGELAAMSDENLREIPGLRLGPVTLAVIHKAQELWRAKQQPDPHAGQTGPSARLQGHPAGQRATAAQLDFPDAGSRAGPGGTASVSQHRPAGSSTRPRGPGTARGRR